MSKEKGILTKENTNQILKNIDREFFSGGFEKIGDGHSHQADPDMQAYAAMHNDMVIAGGKSTAVKDMNKVAEIVKNAESSYIANQAARQNGGMGL